MRRKQDNKLFFYKGHIRGGERVDPELAALSPHLFQPEASPTATAPAPAASPPPLPKKAEPVAAVTPAAAEDKPPWAGYDDDNIDEIAAQLDGLSLEQLLAVEAYETEHKDRKGVHKALSEYLVEEEDEV